MPSLSGLSGFDAEAVVSQLVAIERTPLNRLNAKKQAEESRLTILQSSRALINGVRLAAQDLTRSTLWRSVTTTSSQTSVASVTVGPSPVSASASFTVDSLATPRELISNSSFASLSSVASTGTPTRATSLSAAAATLGLSAITASGALADGTYAVTTTASSASKVTGGALAASVTIGASNNTLTLTNSYGADSITGTITVASGTYTQEGLAAAVNNAIAAASLSPTAGYTTAQNAGQRPSGLGITASVENGALVLASEYHGSGSTITVDSGLARNSLSLKSNEITSTAGSVGSLSVNGSAVDLGTLLVPGTTLTAAGGELSLTLGTSGLSAGSSTLSVATTTPTKTLTQMIDEINTTSSYRASAISDGAGGYKLHVASPVAGAASTVDLSAYVIDGGTSVEHAGTDAQVTLADGTVRTSTTNVFTNILTGSTVTLSATSATAVDVAVNVGAASVDSVASKIQALVNALNSSLGDINRHTGYDTLTGRSGELAREGGLRRAASQMRQALLGSGVSPSEFGITVDRTGTFGFDRSKLNASMAADPDRVQSLLAGTGGLVTRLADAASAAAFGQGSVLGAAENTKRSTIRRYTGDMDALTRRLEKRETTLRAQFTQLEMGLSRLKGQQDWLTNQINSLNGMNKN